MPSTRAYRYAPANYCIYCGEREPLLLTDEHIIPVSLGGQKVLPKASCKKCAKITRGITETVARSMYGRLRVRQNIKTRNPKQRPSHFPLIVVNPQGVQREVILPAELWPRSYPVLLLKEATILSGIKQSTFQMQILGYDEDIQDLCARGYISNTEVIRFQATVHAGALCRQLAQIAHALAVAEIGSDTYQDFLIPIIVGTNVNSYDPFMFIGSAPPDKQLIRNELALDILTRRDTSYVSCRYTMGRLGSNFPTYQLVCGVIPDEASMKLIRSRIASANKQ